MDQGLRVPEEHRCDDGPSNGDLSTVTVYDWDRTNIDLIPELVGLFYEFWYKVQGEDLSYPVTYEWNGETKTIPAIEAMFYRVVEDGAKIKFIVEGQRFIGLLVYHNLFDSIVVVRHLIIEKGFEGQGLSKLFIESMPFPVKYVIFQTAKDTDEQRIHEITSRLRIKVAETDKLITWMMPWEE